MIAKEKKHGILSSYLFFFFLPGMFSSEVQFGHAGACANAERETAVAKNKALSESGAKVPISFDELGEVCRWRKILSEVFSHFLGKIRRNRMITKNSNKFQFIFVQAPPPPPPISIIFLLSLSQQMIHLVYRGLLEEGIIVPKEEVPPPTVPMDYNWARVRLHLLFFFEL